MKPKKLVFKDEVATACDLWDYIIDCGLGFEVWIRVKGARKIRHEVPLFYNLESEKQAIQQAQAHYDKLVLSCMEKK